MKKYKKTTKNSNTITGIVPTFHYKNQGSQINWLKTRCQNYQSSKNLWLGNTTVSHIIMSAKGLLLELFS